MNFSTQSIRPHNDLARKGEAALDLIHRAADTMSEMENQIETRLLQTLDQLKTAEDQHGILTARVIRAEGQASEAVKWLTRLHDEVVAKLGSPTGLPETGVVEPHPGMSACTFDSVAKLAEEWLPGDCAQEWNRNEQIFDSTLRAGA